MILVEDAPSNAPGQSPTMLLATAVAAQVLNQMADDYGRNLIFSEEGTQVLEHEELLRQMQDKAGDDEKRRNIAESARRLLQPVIEIRDLLLVPNTRTQAENQAIAARIERDLVLELLPFFGILPVVTHE